MIKLFAIARKDTILRFSGLVEWLFFLILPVFFTFILAGGTGPRADNRVRLLVVDQANSTLSTELLSALEGSEAIRPQLTTFEDAQDQFSSRSASSYLLIPATFNIENLVEQNIQLEFHQQPNNLNALVARQAAGSVLSRVGSSIQIASLSLETASTIIPFTDPADKVTYFNESLSNARKLLAEAPDRVISTQASTPDQITYDPRANSSAGQMITWVFIPLIGLSEMFAFERQRGTLRRILTTPTQKATYLFGTIIGQVLLALLQMTILIIFGILVMKVNWGSNLPGLAVILISGVLSAAALGTMLGTFVKTPNQAQGLSIMLGMVMGLMGGCWYPIELFPVAIQNFVKIFPTTWTMQGLMDLVARGQGLIGILPEAGVLLAFSSVFFIIGIARFRYE